MIHTEVPFNRAPFLGNELDCVRDAASQRSMSGGGKYSSLCENHLSAMLGSKRVFLTPSCTSALEMSAILLNIGHGSEVIIPSFTFVSTANAFAIFGATPVFVDVDKDTMNITPETIERAISARTKAIVVVHYAGIACDMDAVLDISRRYGIPVVEDAAQAIGSGYKGKLAGTFGALAAFSFHETKNITSGGEGGLLVVNDASLLGRASIVQEKGTNRAAFRAGRIDKYTWIDRGSSYLMNEISAAWLWAQLCNLERVNNRRLLLHGRYHEGLKDLADCGLIDIQPLLPDHVTGNGHMFFLKAIAPQERNNLLSFLEFRGVQATSHYIPLHSSVAGRKYGRLSGDDKYTTSESERLVRLPLFYNMTDDQHAKVISSVQEFYGS